MGTPKKIKIPSTAQVTYTYMYNYVSIQSTERYICPLSPQNIISSCNQDTKMIDSSESSYKNKLTKISTLSFTTYSELASSWHQSYAVMSLKKLVESKLSDICSKAQVCVGWGMRDVYSVHQAYMYVLGTY